MAYKTKELNLAALLEAKGYGPAKVSPGNDGEEDGGLAMLVFDSDTEGVQELEDAFYSGAPILVPVQRLFDAQRAILVRIKHARRSGGRGD